MAAFLPFVYLTGNACVAAYFFRLAILKFAGGKGPSHAKYEYFGLVPDHTL